MPNGFSIGAIAPQDETKTRTFLVLGHPTEITYYPNRFTLEGEDFDRDDDDNVLGDEDVGASAEERLALRAAENLCRLVKSWDFTGPLKDRTGKTIIEADEPVPVEPAIVRFIPLRIIRRVNDLMVERELGNQRSRRR